MVDLVLGGKVAEVVFGEVSTEVAIAGPGLRGEELMKRGVFQLVDV